MDRSDAYQDRIADSGIEVPIERGWTYARCACPGNRACYRAGKKAAEMVKYRVAFGHRCFLQTLQAALGSRAVTFPRNPGTSPWLAPCIQPGPALPRTRRRLPRLGPARSGKRRARLNMTLEKLWPRKI